MKLSEAFIVGLPKPSPYGVEGPMGSEVKRELLRLAKRLRRKAEEFERARDYGRAGQVRFTRPT